MFRIIAVANLFLLTVDSAFASYDNSNIKEPLDCPRLLQALVSNPKTDLGVYGLKISKTPSVAGRYDMVIVDSESLGSKHERGAFSKTQGRLFFRTAASPMDASHYFQRWVKAPLALVAIPHDEASAKALYGPDLAPDSVKLILDQMNKVREKLKGVGTAEISTEGRPLSKAILMRAIESAQNDAVLLVAHNHAGQILLPNGDQIGINDLQALANEKGKALVVVSCDTIDSVSPTFEGLVSTQRLTFEGIAHGLTLAESKRAQMKGQTMFMGDVIYYLDQGISAVEKAGDRKVRLVVTGVSGSVLLLGAVAVGEQR